MQTQQKNVEWLLKADHTGGLRLGRLAAIFGAKRWFAGIAVISIANLWIWGAGRNDVLEAAYLIPNGGGYCNLADTGVNETIRQNGSLILSASKGGTYCCGYTFEVAMRIAEQRGLLADKSVSKVRRFQQEWYGSVDSAALKQCAAAVCDLGIGREIALDDAQPGDFVAFQRNNGIGHSVVFLGWVKNQTGKKVGIHFRSSQPGTDGIGDASEFFADSGYVIPVRGIDRSKTFVARIKKTGWSAVLNPFE